MILKNQEVIQLTFMHQIYWLQNGLKQNIEKRLDFESEYEKQYGKRPEKVAYLGYDASEIIVNSINKGNSELINIELSKLNKYQGVSGYINFYNNSGANSEAEIIKIKNHRFNKLEK